MNLNPYAAPNPAPDMPTKEPLTTKRVPSLITRGTSLLAVVHMMTVGVTTLAANYVVESVVFTGAACAMVALPLFLAAAIQRRWLLVICSGITLLVETGFIVFELIMFLYPADELALPLCLVFLGLDAMTLCFTWVDLHWHHQDSKINWQKTVFYSLLLFAVAAAISLLAVLYFPKHLVPHTSQFQVAFRFPRLPAFSLALLLAMIAVCISMAVKIAIRHLGFPAKN